MSHLIKFDKDETALAELSSCCSAGLVCDAQTMDPPPDSGTTGSSGGGLVQVGCLQVSGDKNNPVRGLIFMEIDDLGIPKFWILDLSNGSLQEWSGSIEQCRDYTFNKTDCIYVGDSDDPFCELTIYECQATPGVPYVLNPETFLYEAVDVSKVGKNEPNDNVCVYPFECEVVGDGATPITPASIIALQAGAVFPGTALPADDAATVHLHEYEITLGHLGDEAAGFEGGATACDAIHTTVGTSKEINMEPGGTVGTSVPAGNSVPDFENVPADGAVVRVCGKLSVRKAKDGTAIAISEKEAG